MTLRVFVVLNILVMADTSCGFSVAYNFSSGNAKPACYWLLVAIMLFLSFLIFLAYAIVDAIMTTRCTHQTGSTER